MKAKPISEVASNNEAVEQLVIAAARHNDGRMMGVRNAIIRQVRRRHHIRGGWQADNMISQAIDRLIDSGRLVMIMEDSRCRGVHLSDCKPFRETARSSVFGPWAPTSARPTSSERRQREREAAAAALNIRRNRCHPVRVNAVQALKAVPAG